MESTSISAPGFLASPIELRPRSIGELLDLTFSLYRRQFRTFVAIAAVLSVPLLLDNLVNVLTAGASLAWDVRNDYLSSALACLTAILSLGIGVCWPWMDGALTLCAVEQMLGRTQTWRQAYAATRRRWGSLWGAIFLRSITLGGVGFLAAVVAAFMAAFGQQTICVFPAVLIGFALTIVIALNCGFSTPVIVSEDMGATQSLSRSQGLVKDNRWRLLGRLFIFWLMQVLVIGAPSVAVQWFGSSGPFSFRIGNDVVAPLIAQVVASLLISAVSYLVVTPLNAIYIALNYIDLRIRKENLDLQVRAANLVVKPPAQVLASVPEPAPGTPAPSPIIVQEPAPDTMDASPAAAPALSDQRGLGRTLASQLTFTITAG
jgi:hypothetical protein